MAQLDFIADTERINKYRDEKELPLLDSEHLQSEAEDFRLLTQHRWEESGGEIIPQIEEITGLSIRGIFNIFTLLPGLEMGQYLDAQNIEWGLDELFPNYTTIGIAHELLHCVTHEFYDKLPDDEKWIFHAIVYLSADEELFRRIDASHEYFTSSILATYHPRLIESARHIFPYWQERMSNMQRKNICFFL